jgi:N-acetylglucosaminyldiphosphoundecaprenol N-acetyl-beta-D-mannosaminyltransferase
VRFGHLWVDAVTFDGALAAIEALVEAGQGGAVFTPNIDHVVTAEDDPAFRAAYDAADLVLPDGKPLLWAARLLGARLPEKVSGSDLVWPLLERAARRRWRVYLLGGAPGVVEDAAARFQRDLGLEIAGVDCPQVALDPAPGGDDAVVERVRRAAPHLLLVALGAPKQERFIHRNAGRLGPVVSLGIGASLDFLTGRIRRAPRWMSHAGLEWLHRMAQDPGRLAHRYLVKDPRFVAVLLRTVAAPRADRVVEGAPPPTSSAP